MTATAKRPTTQSQVGEIVAHDADDIAHDRGQDTLPPLGKNETQMIIRNKVRINFVKPPSKQSVKPVTFTPIAFPFVREKTPGIPSVEDDVGVIAARLKFNSINAQYSEARTARLAAAEALDLDTDSGYSQADLEIVAGELIANGKSTEAIDKLEALMKTESRLRVAAELAAREIEPALTLAITECNQEVLTERLLPAKRAVALAWISLLRADRDHHSLVFTVQVSGLNPGNGGCNFFSVAPLMQDGRATSTLRELHNAGIVTADEVSGLL